MAVIGGLLVAAYTTAHGWTAPVEYQIMAAMIAGVVAYCVLDKFILGHLGDAVYFDVIEDQVVKSASAIVEKSEMTIEYKGKKYTKEELDELLALLKE